jgi:hypothetical protein
MDWDAIGEMNREYLGTDRVNQLGIQLGFWERLMSAMGVMEGAIALIDDEQKEGVHRFFDYLATLYQDYITRLSKVCRLDSVVIHDDWGHQASSFFSLDTCLEMIVPHLKRVVGTIHDLGMLYEHHSCGKASSMVPAMIEAGVDWWMPQPALNDLDDLVETYIDSPITFAVSCPKLSPSLKEEQIKEMAQLGVSKYKDKGVILAPNMIFASDNDISKYPCFKDAVYTYSRIAYQDCE